MIELGDGILAQQNLLSESLSRDNNFPGKALEGAHLTASKNTRPVDNSVKRQGLALSQTDIIGVNTGRFQRGPLTQAWQRIHRKTSLCNGILLVWDSHQVREMLITE